MFRLWAASAGQRLAGAVRPAAAAGSGAGWGGWGGSPFLSLSQAAKPGTWALNYSSHRAARQQEEGARRAGKENKEEKKTLPARPEVRARGR